MSRLQTGFNPLHSLATTRWTLLLITGVAFLLRVISLDTQSLWRDETDSIWFAGWRLRHLLEWLITDGNNGPLYFLFLRYWQMMLDTSEFAVRFPSAVAGTLVIPLGYMVTRQLNFSRYVGLLLALLLATSPYLIWYAQETKMYAIWTALILTALIAYLKALDGNGKKWWATFVIAVSLSFYLHILSPLMLPVYGAIGLLKWPSLRRQWRGWLISMGCLTLPYLPLVIWHFEYVWSGEDRGHPFYPFTEQIYLQLQLYSSGLLQSVGLTAVVLYLFLLLTATFLTNRRSVTERLRLSRRLMLLAWLLLPTVLIHLISLRVPIFEDRYVIYVTPVFYLLAALGIVLLRQHSKLLAALCLGLALSINLLGVWQHQRQPIKPDFRAAATHLAQQAQRPAVIMIQTPYLQRTFDYYYPHNYKFLEGLWTNNGKTPAEVDKEMTRLTGQLVNLWLVVSEEALWDNRALVRNWLTENAHLADEAHFTRVAIYHYQFRPGTINTPGTSVTTP